MSTFLPIVQDDVPVLVVFLYVTRLTIVVPIQFVRRGTIRLNVTAMKVILVMESTVPSIFLSWIAKMYMTGCLIKVVFTR